MKLTYKILWFEDRIQEPEYKEMVTKIDRFLLEEEFFEPEIVCVEDSDEFEKMLDETYDLIITDYNLGEKNGDEIIEYIRSSGMMTEILFYSANKELSPLSSLLSNSRITFHQLSEANSYKELNIKIKELIELTINKFHHIISMRGMVMAETSELDVLMEEILTTILDIDSEKKSNVVIKEKYIASITEQLEAFNKIDEIKQVAILLRKIGAFHRWRAIQRCCPEEHKATYKEILEKYQVDIIKVRNILAHAKYYKEGEKEFLKNADPEGEPHNYDAEECKKIRKNLNHYKKNLIEFQTKIAKK